VRVGDFVLMRVTDFIRHDVKGQIVEVVDDVAKVLIDPLAGRHIVEVPLENLEPWPSNGED